MTQFDDDREAVTTIAGKSAEGVGLLVALMNQSQRHDAALLRDLYEGMERERDEWKERALAAEAHLSRVAARFDALIFSEYSPLDRWAE